MDKGACFFTCVYDLERKASVLSKSELSEWALLGWRLAHLREGPLLKREKANAFLLREFSESGFKSRVLPLPCGMTFGKVGLFARFHICMNRDENNTHSLSKL